MIQFAVMSELVSHNEVNLRPEGYVEIRLLGDQDYQTIEAIGKACRPIIDRLNYEHKPILGLIDFSEDRSFNAGSNKASLEVLEHIPYHRAAMYGTHPVLIEIGRALIAALGKGKNTKVFNSREEALAWLLMKDPLEG